MGSASETCKFDFPSEGWLDMERGMSSKGGGITWRQPKCESISDCVREPDRDHLEVKTKPISHLSTLQATEKLSKKSSLCFLSADILSITTSSLFLHILKIFPKISCWNHKNSPPQVVWITAILCISLSLLNGHYYSINPTHGTRGAHSEQKQSVINLAILFIDSIN